MRAVGESPIAAEVAGVAREPRVGGVRFSLAAHWVVLAGGTLVVAQAGTFAEGMSAGRGFIAIAIVALGRWRAGGVLAAGVAFGAASALQYLFQARGWTLPYQAFLALALRRDARRPGDDPGPRRAPAALGQAESDDA